MIGGVDKQAMSVQMRTKGDIGKRNYGKWRQNHFLLENEWEDNGDSWANRDNEDGWEHRYQYESSIVTKVIETNDYKTVLELGSGPGKLSHYVRTKLLTMNKDVDEYHLIDKEHAAGRFKKRKYNGKFFVKDLFNQFDTTGLNKKYDFIVANDFLEHIANPSDIINKCWNMCHSTSSFYISVPNWRMNHNFIYRGLFDWDNFKYFMWVHGFTPIMVTGSDMKTPKIEKMGFSESTLPDELVDSWNWYFLFKKITEEMAEEI